jgi:3-oxoacyl-[acyl-carrier-protein] synthase-3
MSFAIQGVATQLGETRIDIRENEKFLPVIEKTGIRFVFETSGTAIDLASGALDQLMSEHPDALSGPSALICVSQSPEYFLPSMSCQLQEKCQLPTQLLAFDLGQGCSGFVQALIVGTSLLANFKNIVIVTTDTYRSKLRKDDRATAAVFSDGASATWISSGGPLEIIAESHFTDGSGKKFLFQKVHEEQSIGQLSMSGADVLLFTQRIVPVEVENLMKATGKNSVEIGNWYLHQASKLVLDRLEAKIQPAVPFHRNIHEVGNLVSSSIPFLLARDISKLNTGLTVMSGFGVGLSASSVLISSR